MTEISSKILELKQALHSLTTLEIKLKVSLSLSLSPCGSICAQDCASICCSLWCLCFLNIFASTCWCFVNVWLEKLLTIGITWILFGYVHLLSQKLCALIGIAFSMSNILLWMANDVDDRIDGISTLYFIFFTIHVSF